MSNIRRTLLAALAGVTLNIVVMYSLAVSIYGRHCWRVIVGCGFGRISCAVANPADASSMASRTTSTSARALVRFGDSSRATIVGASYTPIAAGSVARDRIGAAPVGVVCSARALAKSEQLA